MSHQRTVIRDALVSLLKTGNPTNAADRVYSNRAFNIKNQKLPAIRIEDQNEVATPRDFQRPPYIRQFVVKLEIYVEASTNIGTAADDIALQIENLIKNNTSISGTASSTLLQSTEFVYEEAEKTLGKTTLIYEIKYFF